MGHVRWVQGVTGARRHIGGAPGRHLVERFSRAHCQLILGSVQVLKWPPTSRPERAATSTIRLGIPHDGVCEALALEFVRGGVPAAHVGYIRHPLPRAEAQSRWRAGRVAELVPGMGLGCRTPTTDNGMVRGVKEKKMKKIYLVQCNI